MVVGDVVMGLTFIFFCLQKYNKSSGFTTFMFVNG